MAERGQLAAGLQHLRSTENMSVGAKFDAAGGVTLRYCSWLENAAPRDKGPPKRTIMRKPLKIFFSRSQHSGERYDY